MSKTHKQSSDESGTSKQLTRKQQRQLTARLEQEFPITGLHITRQNLETLGYDTANVIDAVMEELAGNLGSMIDWQSDDAAEIAAELNIPKHQSTATNSTE
jgi:hypothetical protein